MMNTKDLKWNLFLWLNKYLWWECSAEKASRAIGWSFNC